MTKAEQIATTSTKNLPSTAPTPSTTILLKIKIKMASKFSGNSKIFPTIPTKLNQLPPEVKLRISSKTISSK